MITANVDEVIKSLMAYKAEVDRKLTYMVRGFAYEITRTAISNTPLGDAEEHMALYLYREQRAAKHGVILQPEEGFAQGSWQVSTDGAFSVQAIYGTTAGGEALSLSKTSLNAYKLGQTLYIGNKGYYIRNLENGSSDQAPMGIMKPTTDHIMSVLQADLVRLYNQG